MAARRPYGVHTSLQVHKSLRLSWMGNSCHYYQLRVALAVATNTASKRVARPLGAVQNTPCKRVCPHNRACPHPYDD